MIGLVKETSQSDSLSAAPDNICYLHLFLTIHIHHAFICYDHIHLIIFSISLVQFKVLVLPPNSCHLFLSLKPIITKGYSPVQDGFLLDITNLAILNFNSRPWEYISGYSCAFNDAKNEVILEVLVVIKQNYVTKNMIIGGFNLNSNF